MSKTPAWATAAALVSLGLACGLAAREVAAHLDGRLVFHVATFAVLSLAGYRTMREWPTWAYGERGAAVRASAGDE